MNIHTNARLMPWRREAPVSAMLEQRLTANDAGGSDRHDRLLFASPGTRISSFEVGLSPGALDER